MVTCGTSGWTSATTLACTSGAASTVLGVGAVSVSSVAGTALSAYSFDGVHSPTLCCSRLQLGRDCARLCSACPLRCLAYKCAHLRSSAGHRFRPAIRCV
jgi:hypothetical protein